MEDEEKNAFELKNVTLKLDEQKTIFKNLSIQVKQGENLSILGRGGSGKTTLCKLLVGLLNEYEGDLYLFGKNYRTIDPKSKTELRRNITMSFQQGALFDFMTVRENIEFALENLSAFPKESYRTIVNDHLKLVDLENAADMFPNELSGGMRRRVGIIRALASAPKLVFFDEPTAGLDPITSHIVISLIQKISKETKSTVVCMTSMVETALVFSDRIGVLEDGHIMGLGTKEELHALQSPFIEKFFSLRQINI